MIKAVTAQTESNNTENVFSVLGRVPTFTFDMNMKTYIFSRSGVISLVYLFVCMNIFSAFRSIPSGTIDIILKSCILNRHKLSQFFIKAVTWHIDSNNTENVLWVLGRVPMFTFDMNMKSFIFADSGVISLVLFFVCISVYHI